ncbi:PaaI family thioesterase [Streptomyces sp. URMC 129]|uniref:PaaI family thioesterase n=1 Tax=Streptomyces sp. URMC 129 TaxID=3423407 RepID=UPI003F1DA0D6
MSADQTAAAPESWGAPRSKTITWYDPRVTTEAGAAMSGLDHLRAMADGELPPPPIAAVFGMTFLSAEKGDVVFACTPDESAYNPIGLIHGGLVCTLLDTVAGCAVQSTLPAGTGFTSIEIKVNYLRPVHAGMRLRAHGRLTKPGRRVAFAEGDIRDADDKILATASSACLILGD